MYKVIEAFTDLEDNNYVYNVGDKYPHENSDTPTKKRIEFLASADNKLGKPVIEKIAEKKKK